MRSLVFSFAVLAAMSSAALAQDMDDVAAPPPDQKSEDAKFVAYDQPLIAFTHAEIVDGTGGKPKYDQTLIVKDGASRPSARMSTFRKARRSSMRAARRCCPAS